MQFEEMPRPTDGRKDRQTLFFIGHLRLSSVSSNKHKTQETGKKKKREKRVNKIVKC